MALLNANGQLGKWDLDRVRREIDGSLVIKGQQFALCGDEIVAAAGVYDRHRGGKDAWEIGWIASHPGHRGRNLGGQVTARALAVALQLGPRPIYLLTDDFRLPALKVYLKLGFVPDMGHPSYAGRWQAIFERLGESYATYRSLLPPRQQEKVEP
jgi:mycothiol synthase